MAATINRAAASQALAKAIAYHQAGTAAMAKEWAEHGDVGTSIDVSVNGASAIVKNQHGVALWRRDVDRWPDNGQPAHTAMSIPVYGRQ